MGNEGLISLSSDGLKFNSSLLTLNIRGNQFSKIGLESLVQNLPSSLVELDLSDNNIKDSGLKIVSNALFN